MTSGDKRLSVTYIGVFLFKRFSFVVENEIIFFSYQEKGKKINFLFILFEKLVVNQLNC